MEIVKNTFEPRWELPKRKSQLGVQRKGECLYRMIVEKEDLSVLSKEYGTNEGTLASWRHTVDAFYKYLQGAEADDAHKTSLECQKDRDDAMESLRTAHQQIESVLGILSSKAILEF